MKSPIKIKICGMRNLNDIEILNLHKPEYAGFILAESKRRIDFQTLQELIFRLDQNIIPVGVFVNEDIKLVCEAVKRGIKVIQLHGDENKQYILDLKESLKDSNIAIWKVFRIGGNNAVWDMPEIDGIMLDKYSKEHYGGSGETFDWGIIDKLKISKKLILAGGLSAQNLIEAIDLANPYCVDVSSSVEVDGKKDNDLICKFIETVRKSRL